MDDLLGRQTYKLDITFVIDTTGSMTSHMEQVREKVLSFGDYIVKEMADANYLVSQLRVRLIDFADFATEGEDALHSTEFFTLPDEKDKLRDAVNGIDIKNHVIRLFGNGLEALFIAMESDWTSFGADIGHHIIVVISNTLPFELHEKDGCAGYISILFPRDIEEMEELWSEEDAQNAITKLNPKRKMLFLFVPDGTIAGRTWDQIKGWEKTYTHPISEFSEMCEQIGVAILRYPDLPF